MRFLDACITACIAWAVSEIVAHKKLRWFLSVCINHASDRFTRDDLKSIKRYFVLPWNDDEDKYDEAIASLLSFFKKRRG